MQDTTVKSNKFRVYLGAYAGRPFPTPIKKMLQRKIRSKNGLQKWKLEIKTSGFWVIHACQKDSI